MTVFVADKKRSSLSVINTWWWLVVSVFSLMFGRKLKSALFVGVVEQVRSSHSLLPYGATPSRLGNRSESTNTQHKAGLTGASTVFLLEIERPAGPPLCMVLHPLFCFPKVLHSTASACKTLTLSLCSH